MREQTVASGLVYLGAAAASFFFLTPVLYMVMIGFCRTPDLLAAPGRALFTLQNYLAVLTDDNLHFMAYLRNSLIVAALSAMACVAAASLAAFAITRFRIPGKMAFLFSVLAVAMFPQICIVGYLFKFMSGIGWINTLPGLIFPYTAWSLPLTLWILVSYFSKIPRGLDKAAIVDGCTPWQALYKVILPVAAPGIFSALLLAFIFAFNEFMFALMLTTDYRSRTVPVGIALFQGLHGEIPWGEIMAVSALATAPVILCVIIFQRAVVQGLTRGAIKG
jgi:multiple sugar transport system permease protein